MTPKQIVQDLEETLTKIRIVEGEFQLKKELLEKEFETKKSKILSEIGINMGETVILEILEYRDDSIHCFAVHQIAECVIHGVELKTAEKDDKFLAPVLKKKDKKKAIFFNPYLRWNLKDQSGKVILSHDREEVIIPGTYTEKQLEDIRSRYAISQKI